MNRKRPKYLDLLRIRMPIPSVVSILHRISGAALFLVLPLLLWLLQASLTSPESYAHYQAVLRNPLIKLMLIGLLWAFVHHLLAGLRFLALDLHLGTALAPARASSWAVLASAIAVTAVLGAWLW